MRERRRVVHVVRGHIGAQREVRQVAVGGAVVDLAVVLQEHHVGLGHAVHALVVEAAVLVAQVGQAPVLAVQELDHRAARLAVEVQAVEHLVDREVAEADVAPVVAGVAHAEARIRRGRQLGEQLRAEGGLAVAGAGVQLHGLLRQLHRRVAADADAGILREHHAAGFVEQLDVHRPLPGRAALEVVAGLVGPGHVQVAGHIDAGGVVEQVHRVGHQRDDREEAARSHVRPHDERARGHLAGRQAGAEGARAHDRDLVDGADGQPPGVVAGRHEVGRDRRVHRRVAGAVVDGDRARVHRRGRGGLAAVERVADGGQRVGRGQYQAERGGVEAGLRREHGRGRHLRGHAVGRARRRHVVHRPRGRAVGLSRVRLVRRQQHGRRLVQQRHAVGRRQQQRFARSADLEVGMQLAAGQYAVLVRGPHHQPPVGRHRSLRELPLERQGGVIAQPGAGQVHGRRAGIVELDPVGEGAVDIGQRAGVGAHELVDDHRLGRRRDRQQTDHGQHRQPAQGLVQHSPTFQMTTGYNRGGVHCRSSCALRPVI